VVYLEAAEIGGRDCCAEGKVQYGCKLDGFDSSVRCIMICM